MVLHVRLDRCSPGLDAERKRGRMPGLRRRPRAHVDAGSECLEHFRACRDQKSEDRIAKPFILLAFQPSCNGRDPV